MKKQTSSARGRYVSAQKVQELFAQLGIELCAGRKRIRAARSEKFPSKVCGFKKNHHLCSVYHLNQATMFANRLPLAFFMPIGYLYSSVPCGALMRPQPDSGGRQRGAELFLFPSRNSQHIVSF